MIEFKATRADPSAGSRQAASVVEFKARALLNTEVEVNYYRNGGILHTVLRNLVR